MLPIYRREQRSVGQNVIDPCVGIGKFLVVGIGHFHKRKSILCNHLRIECSKTVANLSNACLNAFMEKQAEERTYSFGYSSALSEDPLGGKGGG